MNIVHEVPASAPPLVLTYVLLHGRYAVLQDLVNAVRIQLDEIRWLLRPDRRYRAPALVGFAFWQLLDAKERRLVGSVISHLVKVGDLPLIKLEKRSEGAANEYVLDVAALPNQHHERI